MFITLYMAFLSPFLLRYTYCISDYSLRLRNIDTFVSDLVPPFIYLILVSRISTLL